MILQISHHSTYEYDEPIALGLQQIRLTPRSHPAQRVVEWETRVEGATKQVEFDDHYMNRVELYRFLDDQSVVEVTSRGVVETTDTAGVLPRLREAAPLWLYLRSTPLTTMGPKLAAVVDSITLSGDDTVERLHDLSAMIREAVAYETGSTAADSTVEQVLEIGSGVCQDHAHVFITAARALGLPARYVSGYLMLADRVDHEATHAWAEVQVDELGWVGFDVSNGYSPDDRYVRIAVGLDYRAAAPISGIRYGSADERLQVSLQVQQ